MLSFIFSSQIVSRVGRSRSGCMVLLISGALLAGCSVESTETVSLTPANNNSVAAAPNASLTSNAPAPSIDPQAAAKPSEVNVVDAAKSFYTVDHYDIEADPAKQLEATLKRAKAENKSVLVQVGGDWCGWCTLMTKYIDETPSVKSEIKKNYLIQKVTYDQKNKNEAFLSTYPKISGYPHLFVLSSDGELLHSQDTGDLEEGKGYSEKVFLDFLKQWAPAAK